jgi:hypothetical protein
MTPNPKLSDKQNETLSQIQAGATLDQLDKRSLSALERRGLVKVNKQRATLSAAGKKATAS